MKRTTALLLATLAFVPTLAPAEQFKQFGDWQVHYIAFNASLLSPEVAERYAIVRGRNKGLLNISAIGPSKRGQKMRVEGRYLNLLSQSFPLEFREIEDDGAVYYLAAFDFQNAEVLRFEIAVELPDQGLQTWRFQQALYVPAP